MKDLLTRGTLALIVLCFANSVMLGDDAIRHNTAGGASNAHALGRNSRSKTIQAVAFQDFDGPSSIYGNPFSDDPVLPNAGPQAVPPDPSDIFAYPTENTAPSNNPPPTVVTPQPSTSAIPLPTSPPVVPSVPSGLPTYAPVPVPAPSLTPVTPAPSVVLPSAPAAIPPMTIPAPTSAPSYGVSAPSCGVSAPSCGVSAPACQTSCTPSCEPSCNASCGIGCGSGSGCKKGCALGLCSCELGDAFTLSGLLHKDCPPEVTFGGWLSAGYHSAGNDLFNSRPDNFALHQGWLYAEKVAEAGSPLGFRVDVMYGIDADDTQAFGNPSGSWDFENGFDRGAFGWAIPQAYGEVALGDSLNVKVGHFYTLVGYEVVTAPDNFFYSHAITMYNSEPFTHTGAVATASMTDNVTLYGGWTLGWDTGFDQLNGGSSWLGGIGLSLSEDASFTYISTAGNFGARGDQAYSHSMVLDVSLTDSLNYVAQRDLVRVDSTGEDNIGFNQYLLYSVSDCLGLGARVEWWKADLVTGYAPHDAVLPAGGSFSYYAATFGANIRPHANLVFRPEVRIDWSPAANYDETYFGIDAVMTF